MPKNCRIVHSLSDKEKQKESIAITLPGVELEEKSMYSLRESRA